MIRVAVLGDVYVSKANESLLAQGHIGSVFGGVPDYLKQFDFVVANLESPLTNSDKKIIKGGPNLKANKNVMTGLSLLGVDAFGLANNHILDYGPDGIDDTLLTLKQHSILSFGAGANILEAKKPVIVDIKGKKIAFVACAENEYSIAGAESYGANPYDPLNIFDDIVKVRSAVDYVIVMYHGGIEHYPYPTPNLINVCRKFIDSGADFVTCQHSHCIGAEEKYKNKTILYGQGNFLFNGLGDEEGEWGKGFIANVCFDENVTVEYCPVISNKIGVELASDSAAKKIISNFNERSEGIKNREFVYKSWENYCHQRRDYYIGVVLGFNRFFYLVNKLSRGVFARIFYREYALRNILNIIRCEAHREMLLGVLDKNTRK